MLLGTPEPSPHEPACSARFCVQPLPQGLAGSHNVWKNPRAGINLQTAFRGLSEIALDVTADALLCPRRCTSPMLGHGLMPVLMLGSSCGPTNGPQQDPHLLGRCLVQQIPQCRDLLHQLCWWESKRGELGSAPISTASSPTRKHP